MDVLTMQTPGLGDATYLVAHEGLALVVDPQRDIDRFRDALADHDLQARFVLETHLHNDYVSGARELARRSGAELVLPAGAGAAYEHVPAFHSEDLDAGAGLGVRPLHTPGHTPEHVSYLVLVEGEPYALFSGGSLLVGSAGRSDLLGDERARQLAVLQFGSLQRLAALPPQVGLYPTHGQGSFCTVSTTGRSTSTIGRERRDNPTLAYPDAETFVKEQLGGLQPYPRYYAHMAPINLMGPTPLPGLPPRELTVAEVRTLGPDASIVDARPRASFAAGHIPGSLGVELSDQFGVWVGWLLPFDAPIVLVLEPVQDVREAATQLGRIGFDDVLGSLWGLEGWQAAHEPLASFAMGDVQQLAGALDSGTPPQVLDVRAPGEWEAEPLEGAHKRYVPDLLAGPPPGIDTGRAVWVVCASGFRSAIAAGLLQRHGLDPVVLDGAGVSELRAATSQAR